MDEHRVGLKPIVRRVWSPPGQRPVVTVHQRYQWLYIYGFVHPPSGRTFWLLMPTVSARAFGVALRHFADFAQAGSRAAVRLLIDRAGWHLSKRVHWPTGIQPWPLTPYSPELQPAEHLWALTDQPLFNRFFDSIEDLQRVLIERCCWLQDHPDLVRSATLFSWWPAQL